MIEALPDGLWEFFEESFSCTPNPARVRTYHDGWFDPVTPEGLMEYLAVPFLTALTLSGEGLVGMTSTGLRAMDPEELDLHDELVGRLTHWLSEAATVADAPPSDQQSRWSEMKSQGADLTRELQQALGSDVAVGYADRVPFQEAHPSDAPEETSTASGSGGFWTTSAD